MRVVVAAAVLLAIGAVAGIVAPRDDDERRPLDRRSAGTSGKAAARTGCDALGLPY